MVESVLFPETLPVSGFRTVVNRVGANYAVVLHLLTFDDQLSVTFSYPRPMMSDTLVGCLADAVARTIAAILPSGAPPGVSTSGAKLATPTVYRDEPCAAELVARREDVQKLDQTLVALLCRRFHLTHEIGRFKRQLGLPVVDETRVARFLDGWREEAAAQGGDAAAIESVARCVHTLVAQRQEQAC